MVFYRKKFGLCIVTQEKNKSFPETIRAQPRGACPEILAARLRGSFHPFNDPQNPPSWRTASLTFTNIIDLGSIYDSLISQADASPNSVKLLVFWPDDKTDPDGEVYAQPESDLQLRVCTSTSGSKRVSCRALVRPWILIYFLDDADVSGVVRVIHSCKLPMSNGMPTCTA
jgi:hypothetical protein